MRNVMELSVTRYFFRLSLILLLLLLVVIVLVMLLTFKMQLPKVEVRPTKPTGRNFHSLTPKASLSSRSNTSALHIAQLSYLLPNDLVLF